MGRLLNASKLERGPDPARLQQADENADAEIEGLGGGVAGRRWKRNAALAEIAVNSALLLHHLIGNGTMKEGNHNPQQQSCNFNHHAPLTLSIILERHNR